MRSPSPEARSSVEPVAAAALGVLVLSTLLPSHPAAAQEETAPEAEAAALTVELIPREEDGVHGVVRIYSLRGEGHAGEAGPGGEADGGGEEGDADGAGAMHAHRFVVELRGLEPGRSHPVHLHHGRCAEGGPVILPLESVAADEEGSGTSRTVLTPEEMMAEMREMTDAGDGGKGGHGTLHPPFFVQAHRPDGTPAACGDLHLGAGAVDDGPVTAVSTTERADVWHPERGRSR